MIKDTGQQFRVLVVDDNPDNIQVVGNFLRSNDFEVGFATNGKEAYNLLLQNLHFDLVLLDVDMPQMNGFETSKLISQNSRLKNIPVIFLTAFTDSEKILEGFNSGGIDYITKPFNSLELLARVKTHLKLKYKTEQVDNMNLILEQKNKNISDSIQYASRIQLGLLPSIHILENTIRDHFLIYKPKNIVSGDFYWFRQIGNYIYIAAADCTGHGVPGAFLSVLGIALLNEIVIESTSISPAQVLGELKNKILNSLWLKNPETITNDGIELALCKIDMNTHQVQYAGAARPLVILHKNSETGRFELSEIKADNISIGVSREDDTEFKNHILELYQNDVLYLYSDGYASQFGGKKGRKFTSSSLKELFLTIQDHSMPDQKLILEQRLSEWSGELNQTDDILIIGLKLSWLS